MSRNYLDFDTTLSRSHPRYHSPGVKLLNSYLRTYTNSRGTPLPEYNSFDFRAGSPMRKGIIPKVTLNSQCNVFDCTRSIDRKKLGEAHEKQYQAIMERRKQPEVYYGPCAPAGAYKSKPPEEAKYALPFRSVSPGSLLTRTFQLRETCRSTFYHDGSLITLEGEKMWSCCGAQEHDQGCCERREMLGRTHCESPFRVVD